MDTFSENRGRFSRAKLLEDGISTSVIGLSENARGKTSGAALFRSVFFNMGAYRVARGLGAAALRFGGFS